MSDIELRAAQWAASENVGTSSKAMLGVMTGRPPKSRFCYPHDGDDLGRCLSLLMAVPEYRERLPEMKVIGPEWAALVDHWAELESLHVEAQHDKLYRRMKEILSPIEKGNPNLVRIGDGASLYFGR